MTDSEWERRVALAWESVDERGEAEFRAIIADLADEVGPGNAAGVFERACALDSTGYGDLAVPLYRQAIELGLDRVRGRRAVIHLASSLRDTGRADEAVALLRPELDVEDELSDAVRAFLALALVETGGEREAVSLALGALAPHLPRYQRSVGDYARLLVVPDHDREPTPPSP